MDENGPLGDTAKSESEPSGIKAHECVEVGLEPVTYYDPTQGSFGVTIIRGGPVEAKPTKRRRNCCQCLAYSNGECRGREPSCDAAGNAVWPQVRGDDWCAQWR
jgi:hypothetical protein